jgi:hypothetical protein
VAFRNRSWKWNMWTLRRLVESFAEGLRSGFGISLAANS